MPSSCPSEIWRILSKLTCHFFSFMWSQIIACFFMQALELMLVDALLLANDHLKLTSHIEGPSRFWKVCVINHFATFVKVLRHHKSYSLFFESCLTVLTIHPSSEVEGCKFSDPEITWKWLVVHTFNTSHDFHDFQFAYNVEDWHLQRMRGMCSWMTPYWRRLKLLSNLNCKQPVRLCCVWDGGICIRYIYVYVMKPTLWRIGRCWKIYWNHFWESTVVTGKGCSSFQSCKNAHVLFFVLQSLIILSHYRIKVSQAIKTLHSFRFFTSGAWDVFRVLYQVDKFDAEIY